MKYKFPYSIENSIGEKLTFLGTEPGPDGDKLIVENFVTPGHGPVMHTHWLQDESLTVVKGRIGYQVLGQGEQFAEPGETILFKRGMPHRFWNAGQDMLHCKGWIYPAHSVVFFLSSIFAAQNKTGTGQPEKFDGAFLMTRYSSEYDMPEIPKFVKRTIIPLTYFVGRILGKYKHFKDAPLPVK